MKRITFLVATILLAVNVAKAASVSHNTEFLKHNYDLNNPIEFSERGITFFVFPNGEFDFNTRPSDTNGDFYFRTAGRRGSVTIESRNPVNYGVAIENDSFGRIRRVGNTFINYDQFDRVNRIGSVFMRYNRFALAQVGGLQLIYNRFGEIIDVYGSVQGNRNYGFTSNYPENCSTTVYGGYPRNHHYENFDEDEQHNNGNYYFKGKKEDKEERKEQKREDKEENKNDFGRR